MPDGGRGRARRQGSDARRVGAAGRGDDFGRRRGRRPAGRVRDGQRDAVGSVGDVGHERRVRGGRIVERREAAGGKLGEGPSVRECLAERAGREVVGVARRRCGELHGLPDGGRGRARRQGSGARRVGAAGRGDDRLGQGGAREAGPVGDDERDAVGAGHVGDERGVGRARLVDGGQASDRKLGERPFVGERFGEQAGIGGVRVGDRRRELHGLPGRGGERRGRQRGRGRGAAAGRDRERVRRRRARAAGHIGSDDDDGVVAGHVRDQRRALGGGVVERREAAGRLVDDGPLVANRLGEIARRVVVVVVGHFGRERDQRERVGRGRIVGHLADDGRMAAAGVDLDLDRGDGREPGRVGDHDLGDVRAGRVGEKRRRGRARVVEGGHAAGGELDEGPRVAERLRQSALVVVRIGGGDFEQHDVAGVGRIGRDVDRRDRRRLAAAHAGRDRDSGRRAGAPRRIARDQFDDVVARHVGRERRVARGRVAQPRGAADGPLGDRPCVGDRLRESARILRVGIDDRRRELHGLAGVGRRRIGRDRLHRGRRVAARADRDGEGRRRARDARRVGDDERHLVVAGHVGHEGRALRRRAGEPRLAAGRLIDERPRVGERLRRVERAVLRVVGVGHVGRKLDDLPGRGHRRLGGDRVDGGRRRAAGRDRHGQAGRRAGEDPVGDGQPGDVGAGEVGHERGLGRRRVVERDRAARGQRDEAPREGQRTALRILRGAAVEQNRHAHARRVRSGGRRGRRLDATRTRGEEQNRKSALEHQSALLVSRWRSGVGGSADHRRYSARTMLGSRAPRRARGHALTRVSG